MRVGDVCIREVSTAQRGATTEDVAKQMRAEHVGTVVIVDSLEQRLPIGIVTDRDIVLSVVATGLDPTVFTAGDLIVQDLITCYETHDVWDCVQQMRTKGIRRMPVVNGDGLLIGIVTVDDLVQVLAREMGELSRLIDHEQAREVETRQ